MPAQRRSTLAHVAMQRIAGYPAARAVVPSATPPVGAPGLVGQLVSRDPVPGRWYAVEPGDTADESVRTALDAYQRGLGDDERTRLAYYQCLTAGRRWNAKLYATRAPTPGYPDSAHVDGWGLARAFEGVNDDGLAAVSAGYWPRRTLDAAGQRVDPRARDHGLVWFPLIDGFLFAEHWLPVCSELDPPGALLDQLHAQPQRSR